MLNQFSLVCSEKKWSVKFGLIGRSGFSESCSEQIHLCVTRQHQSCHEDPVSPCLCSFFIRLGNKSWKSCDKAVNVIMGVLRCSCILALVIFIKCREQGNLWSSQHQWSNKLFKECEKWLGAIQLIFKLGDGVSRVGCAWGRGLSPPGTAALQRFLWLDWAARSASVPQRTSV